MALDIPGKLDMLGKKMMKQMSAVQREIAKLQKLVKAQAKSKKSKKKRSR